MTAIERVRQRLAAQPLRWLVTGSAGFIGSHLTQALLELDQTVVGLDNFSTGHRRNLDDVRSAVGAERWTRHRFIEADIRDAGACRLACRGVDVVLHEAALGSVPRSIADPLRTHAVNATGFLNVLTAAREAGVGRFVYASSSSVYGDHPGLPLVEDALGRPLSPYAASKRAGELYAAAFAHCYGMTTIGLRYFNAFGGRQDPEGDYAAVIPRWACALLERRPVTLHGDGSTTRDFCHIENVVQANLLAATTPSDDALNQVYNVACGARISLLELFDVLRGLAAERRPGLPLPDPIRADPRAGDIRHSLADISKATRLLGYAPTHDARAGLREAIAWYDARAGDCRPAR